MPLPPLPPFKPSAAPPAAGAAGKEEFIARSALHTGEWAVERAVGLIHCTFDEPRVQFREGSGSNPNHLAVDKAHQVLYVVRSVACGQRLESEPPFDQLQD